MEPLMPTDKALELREELYRDACADISTVRTFVKQYEEGRSPFPPVATADRLPPQARMRQPPPGEMTDIRDQLDYMRALVAECEQLTDMAARQQRSQQQQQRTTTSAAATSSSSTSSRSKDDDDDDDYDDGYDDDDDDNALYDDDDDDDDDIGQTLGFARCLVRLREASVDWELAVLHHEENMREVREILGLAAAAASGSGSDSTPLGLGRDELAFMAGELALWDESFPALREAWVAVGERVVGNQSAV